jgi:hypothetical protein
MKFSLIALGFNFPSNKESSFFSFSSSKAALAALIAAA